MGRCIISVVSAFFMVVARFCVGHPSFFAHGLRSVCLFVVLLVPLLCSIKLKSASKFLSMMHLLLFLFMTQDVRKNQLIIKIWWMNDTQENAAAGTGSISWTTFSNLEHQILPSLFVSLAYFYVVILKYWLHLDLTARAICCKQRSCKRFTDKQLLGLYS